MPKLKKLFSRGSKEAKSKGLDLDDSGKSFASSSTGETHSTSAASEAIAPQHAQAAPTVVAQQNMPSTSFTQTQALPQSEYRLAVRDKASNMPSTGTALPGISNIASSVDPNHLSITITNLKLDAYRTDISPEEKSRRMLSEERHSLSLEVPKGFPFSSLYSKIIYAGFLLPENLVGPDGTVHAKTPTRIQIEPFQQAIVNDRKTDNAYYIGLDETLIAFNDRRYGQPLQLNVTKDTTSHHSNQKMVDCLKDERALKITFLRTIRMPDDGKLHNLPAALGTFPLYNVAAYTDALPEKIVNEGGVFLPMWQREALWIAFQSSATDRYALRVSVGRINAISGEKMEEQAALDEYGKVAQDYVVVPGQDWLDGICVGAGKVRQFVAMPLGSGYTVEGQKTGEEKHGGLQIEIIPSLKPKLRGWLKSTSVSDANAFRMIHYRDEWLKEHKTPRELGLTTGDKLHGYPIPAFHEVPLLMSDLVDQDHRGIMLTAKYHADSLQTPSNYSRSQAAEEPSESATRPARAPRRKVESPGFQSFSPPPSYGQGQPYSSGPDVASNHDSSYFSVPLEGVKRTFLSNDDRYTSSAAPTPAFLEETESTADHDEDGGLYRSGAESDPEMAEQDYTTSTKDLRSMGLAAGGLLIQDIYEDRNEPYIWNTAGSKLINIHILDPASCESVTHIVPAPPPIDAEAYAKAGLQFYTVEEQPDERLEGGDFGNVKSVAEMDKLKMQMEEKPLDPTISTPCRCGKRLCDCIVRPCNHQFCHICVREVETLAGSSTLPSSTSRSLRRCPVCQTAVSHVAGFAAPMNLPGEEPVKMRVPVQVLEVRDGRMAFKSVVKSRI